jgi:hypothetical protein
MVFDYQSMLATSIPMIKNLLWGICALVLVTALSYYFFIVRKRKKYYCTIWERGVGKDFQATKTDELVRKKANEGKEFYYTFKNSKIETIPPSDEQIIRKGKREEANYWRINDDTYIPLNVTVEGDQLKFTPMDYDVNILRIQAIDRRSLIYKQRMGLLLQYAPLIGAILVVGLVIVVIYLTFNWLTGVIDNTMGKVDQTVTLLERLVNK